MATQVSLCFVTVTFLACGEKPPEASGGVTGQPSAPQADNSVHSLSSALAQKTNELKASALAQLDEHRPGQNEQKISSESKLDKKDVSKSNPGKPRAASQTTKMEPGHVAESPVQLSAAASAAKNQEDADESLDSDHEDQENSGAIEEKEETEHVPSSFHQVSSSMASRQGTESETFLERTSIMSQRALAMKKRDGAPSGDDADGSKKEGSGDDEKDDKKSGAFSSFSILSVVISFLTIRF